MNVKQKNRFKILPLVLKRQWFDLIAAGIKPEEYREVTDYWFTRLNPIFNNPPEFIRFYLGYQRNRPMIQVRFISIQIGKGKAEWGADPKEFYYVLKFEPYAV
jgi:hypothetical protein